MKVYIMMMCFGAVEEQLFRSVEGQAASDEEEEKWSDHQQRQVDEVKRILTRLSSCSEGYGSSSSWLFNSDPTVHRTGASFWDLNPVKSVADVSLS